jgi:hypothetical protein
MRLAIGLALFVAVSLCSVASGQVRPNQHQKRANKQTDIAHPVQPEPTIPRSVYESSQSALLAALAALHAEQEARSKENRPNYEPWYAPSVLVQIGLLIIGALYTWYARRQWAAIKEQSRLTEEALIADKRAFVCADGLMYFWEADATTGLYNFRLRPRYRNTGATPTKKFRSHVECDIRNAVLPSGHVFVDQDTNVGSGMIPPKVESTGGMAPQNVPITPQDILEAQALRRFIYLWGWMKYYDVFPNTPEHTTHFCWLVLVVGNPITFVPNTLGQPPTPGTLDFTFVQHPEGNDAD